MHLVRAHSFQGGTPEDAVLKVSQLKTPDHAAGWHGAVRASLSSWHALYCATPVLQVGSQLSSLSSADAGHAPTVLWGRAEVQGHAPVSRRQVRLPPSPVPHPPSTAPHGSPPRGTGRTPPLPPPCPPSVRERAPSLPESLRGWHELPTIAGRAPPRSQTPHRGYEGSRRSPSPLPSPLPPPLRCGCVRACVGPLSLSVTSKWR